METIDYLCTILSPVVWLGFMACCVIAFWYNIDEETRNKLKDIDE